MHTNLHIEKDLHNETFHVYNDATLWEAANNIDNEVRVNNPLCDDGGAVIVAIADTIPIEVNIRMAQPIQRCSYQNEITSLNNRCSSTLSDQIDNGLVFKSKQEHQYKIGLYAIKQNFDFTLKRSTSMRWEKACTKDTYNWLMCAIRFERLDYFAIKTFNNHHECSSL